MNITSRVKWCKSPTPPDRDNFQAVHFYKYRYPGGQLVGIETNDGRVISTHCGKEGEYTAVPQGAQKQSYTHDAQYRRTGLTNGLGHTTNYSYTPAGFLSSLAYPTSFGNPNSRDTFRYEYDPEGNLIRRFDPNAPQTPALELVRSPVDSRVEAIDYAGDTPDVTVVYDSFNRVIELQNSVATITYTYDDGDRLVSTTTQYAGLPPLTVRYGYYPDGSRAWMEAPYALDMSGSIRIGTYIYRYQHYPSGLGGFTLGPGECIEVQPPWISSPIKTYFSTDGFFYRQDTYFGNGAPLLSAQASLHARGLISSLYN